MEKNSLFLCIMVIVILGLFSSCNKESSTSINIESYIAPTISLTNPVTKDSVYYGDSYTINGVASTTGKLSMIQFFRSFPYNNSNPEVEVAKSKITKFTDYTSANFSAVIVNIKDTTNFSVKVTDQIGQQTTKAVTITIRNSNILPYKDLVIGGWNSNYGSAFDIDTGTGYYSSQLAEFGSIIDIFFDHSELASYDLDAIDFYPQWYNGGRFPDTGTTFASTTITSAQFDEMKNDDLFKDLETNLKVIPVEVNDVILFTLGSGKKGLLRISGITDPLEDMTFDEIIQK